MKIRFLKFSKFRKPKALRLISLIRLFVASNLAERYLVTLFEDYNFKQSRRIHKGFGQCSDTLESLFD